MVFKVGDGIVERDLQLFLCASRLYCHVDTGVGPTRQHVKGGEEHRLVAQLVSAASVILGRLAFPLLGRE